MIPHLLALAAGVSGWTLTEYVLHRFDGHGMKGRTRFSRVHLAHHADPMWFAPAWEKAVLAAVIVPVVGGLPTWLFGAPGVTFTLGFVAMYLTYEVLHRRIHTHPPATAYGRWMRRHHLAHHFTNPNENHGVTTSLWDHVFRTWAPSDAVRVPRRHAPAWMIDGATGEVLPEHVATYTLRGRAKRDTREAPDAARTDAHPGRAPTAGAGDGGPARPGQDVHRPAPGPVPPVVRGAGAGVQRRELSP